MHRKHLFHIQRRSLPHAWPENHQKGPELMLWARKRMVRNTGFEPVTSAMSRHCSTTELIAHVVLSWTIQDPRKRAKPRQRDRARQVFFNANTSLLTHGYMLRRKDFFGLMHAVLTKVENTRSQDGVCFTLLKNIYHVLKIAGTP